MGKHHPRKVIACATAGFGPTELYHAAEVNSSGPDLIATFRACGVHLQCQFSLQNSIQGAQVLDVLA